MSGRDLRLRGGCAAQVQYFVGGHESIMRVVFPTVEEWHEFADAVASRPEEGFRGTTFVLPPGVRPTFVSVESYENLAPGPMARR